MVSKKRQKIGSKSKSLVIWGNLKIVLKLSWCLLRLQNIKIRLQTSKFVINSEGYLWYPAISTCVNRFLNFCNDTPTWNQRLILHQTITNSRTELITSRWWHCPNRWRDNDPRNCKNNFEKMFGWNAFDCRVTVFISTWWSWANARNETSINITNFTSINFTKLVQHFYNFLTRFTQTDRSLRVGWLALGTPRVLSDDHS